MSDLDHHRHELQASQDEVLRLGRLLSTKDSTIKDLRASKTLVTQELDAAQLAVKTLENNCAVLKAQRDKAMDKAVRAGRFLMRRPASWCLTILLLMSGPRLMLQGVPLLLLLLRRILSTTMFQHSDVL
jgi:hypothetical protein